MPRFLHDQEWLLDSPELLLVSNDDSAQSLLEAAEPNDNFNFVATHRIGVYFEQLFCHLIENISALELLKKNAQVIIDKKTYGEFDAIVYQKDCQLTTHCELAVKFYLQIGGGDKLSDWVGPNLKDRFDDKYSRLINKQLRFSENPMAKQWLKKQNITIDNVKVLTKGRLFYPWDHFTRNDFIYPKQVSSNHAKGFWISYSELTELLDDEQYQWFQLPRFYWFAEVAEIEKKVATELLSVETEFEGFSLQKIVALKDGSEVMRGFVVNDEWLHKAQQRVLD